MIFQALFVDDYRLGLLIVLYLLRASKFAVRPCYVQVNCTIS